MVEDEDIADRYRRMLPDSSQLIVEFENRSMPQSIALNKQDMEKLENELEDCGCIGIEINNYSNPDYSTLRFRRIGMGMFVAIRPSTVRTGRRLLNPTVFEFGGPVSTLCVTKACILSATS